MRVTMLVVRSHSIRTTSCISRYLEGPAIDHVVVQKQVRRPFLERTARPGDGLRK
jgi:hypothetical protein